METQTLLAKSPLTSPNNAFKSQGRKGNIKFDFQKKFSPKQSQVRHAPKIFQRRSIEKLKSVQPIKMKFDVDPLNLFSIVNKKPGTDSPELVSTPIVKVPEFQSLVNEPLNISDPLNLFDEEATVKSGRKRRKKRHRTTSMCNEESLLDSTLNETDVSNISNYLVSPIENRYSFSKYLKPTSLTDSNQLKIKSPKEKLSFRKCSVKSDRSASTTDSSCQNLSVKNKKYQYGNFLCNARLKIDYTHDIEDSPISTDRRVQNFKEEWFKGKKCLDIGCSDGYVTDWIATYFSPKSITGIDLDSGLINIAKNRLRFSDDKSKLDVPRFPLSFQLSYGPISVDNIGNKSMESHKRIKFTQKNFVPMSNEDLLNVKAEYDTIIFLSVTKWIQLNYGDNGLQRTFKKIFLQLRPGGRLIFEPQTYNCYKKSKNLTIEIRKNFDSMRFMPNDFITYLLSSEVGFAQSLCLAYTRKRKTSNARALYLLTKGGSSSLPENI